MTGLQRFMEWWREQGWNTDHKKLCWPLNKILLKAQTLLAEEQKAVPEDKFEKWLESHNKGVMLYPWEVLEKHRHFKAEQRAPADKGLVEELRHWQMDFMSEGEEKYWGDMLVQFNAILSQYAPPGDGLRQALEKWVDTPSKNHPSYVGLVNTAFVDGQSFAADEVAEILSRHTPADDNRPAVTCREADLADWQEHKDEFKKWFAGRNTPAESPEPLAVLADRKGVSVEITPPSFYQTEGEGWDIGVVVPWEGMLYPFDSPTYAECEAKARAYLNGLKDKENI